MRVVGKCIEEQVRQAMASQVRGESDPWCEDQTFWRNAPRLCLLPQVDNRGCIVLQKPENAVGDSVQQTAPDVEKLRRDLVAIIEAREYEAVFRQPARRA
jgi:hypothetical protein